MDAAAAQEWFEPDTTGAALVHHARPRLLEPGELPTGVWRGDELGTRIGETVATGWPELDAALPGGGWPRRAVTEILANQPGVLDFRMLAGVLHTVTSAGGEVVLIAPPKPPHLPGLLHIGVSARQLIWIQAETPAERLWVTEQMVKSDAAGAIVAWLPQARQDQIRRLQVCAQACGAPVFLCRPEAARHEASAAPLRVHADFTLDWQLRVDVFKRRGPTLDAPIVLPSIPGGLERVLTPRLMEPSKLFDAIGRPEAPGAGRIADGRRRILAHAG